MFELDKLPSLSSPKEDEQFDESESSSHMLRNDRLREQQQQEVELSAYHRNVLFQSLVKSQESHTSFTQDSIGNEGSDYKDNIINLKRDDLISSFS